MIAPRLLDLIKKHSDELARSVMVKLASDPDMSDMSKVPPEEMKQRVYEIYHNLSDWMMTRADADLSRTYLEIGARRAAQGVSLATLVGALFTVKEHLLEFIIRESHSDRPVEIFETLSLYKMVDQFFDRAIYHAARGHERAVAARSA